MKISDEELTRLTAGYPPEEYEPTIVSMAKELQVLRAVAAAIHEGEDTLKAHALRIRTAFPMTFSRITDILDAYRASCS